MEEIGESCEICGTQGMLFDAVVDAKQAKVCYDCSQLADVLVIKRPSQDQIQASIKPYTVKERLEHLSGTRRWQMQREVEKSRAQEMRIKAMHAEIGMKIKRAREYLGYTQDKLADAIGVNPNIIDTAESQGKFSEETRRKLEQFLRIKIGEEIPTQEIKTEKIEENQKLDFKSKSLKIWDLLKFKKDR